MSDQRFYVRITRADGSVTYKGPMPEPRAKREADAWNNADTSTTDNPGTWDAVVIDKTPATTAEVRVWMLATRDGARYYPPSTALAR